MTINRISFLTIMIILSSPISQAIVDPVVVKQFDRPLASLMQESEYEQVGGALRKYWGSNPSLREVVQMQRSAMIAVALPLETLVPWRPVAPRWLMILQSWLAARNLSLNMSKADIEGLSSSPESVRYLDLREAGFSNFNLCQLENHGIFTGLDFFKNFSTRAGVQDFWRQVTNPNLPVLATYEKLAQLLMKYDELSQRFKSEVSAQLDPNFVSLLSDDLARALLLADIHSGKDLKNQSDQDLWDAVGDISLISELHKIMIHLRVYDSPDRCIRVF